ncbi:MAG TPA: DsbA family oxidoreductase [Bryobacteraceae bacterium]|jgi:predicted DsbA family dithiol-disulfide isomerase
MEQPGVIQVVSDVVCPWCYIGKRRLEKALERLGRGDVAVRWTAFQLNPGAPREGWNRREYRTAKFGSAEVSARLEARVAEAGAQEGIGFRFDRIEKTPNTFDAHRLIWLAGQGTVQDAVVERLFQAYFLEGRNVGDRAILREIGTSAGLEGSRIGELFAGELGVAEVRREEEAARSYGVSGVPTFFLNGEPLTSGAHPPELLANMLRPVLGENVCTVGTGDCG